MNCPVLFIIFKRAKVASRTFAAIRKAKPSQLFLAADGPRSDRNGEEQLCFDVREKIESLIDWPCDVRRLYRNNNLGCRIAVSSAIDWFYNHVEEGIILEDDTLPSDDFFRFASIMLERYREEEHIMHISGNNHQHGRTRGDGAYYASRFAHSWGWATWGRAWRLYDREMTGFPADWDLVAEECGLPARIREWWREALTNTRNEVVDTWDFQWHYTVMKNQGLCLIPNRNLVINIGVGEGATHMKKRDVASSIKLQKLTKFDSPSSLEICAEADAFDFEHAVTNCALPWRTPSEVLRSWNFECRQRFF